MSAALIRMVGVFLLACGVMAIWGGGDSAWPDSAWWLFPGLVAYMMGDFYGQLLLRREIDRLDKTRKDGESCLGDRITSLRADCSNLCARLRENEERVIANDIERDFALSTLAGCGLITRSEFVPPPVYLKSVVNMILRHLGLKLVRTHESVKLEAVPQVGKKVRRG